METFSSQVIITGASSGIGKAAAVRFAQEGWDVCLFARREPLLQEIYKSLPKGRHLIPKGDTYLTKRAEHQSMANRRKANFNKRMPGRRIGNVRPSVQMNNSRAPNRVNDSRPVDLKAIARMAMAKYGFVSVFPPKKRVY